MMRRLGRFLKWVAFGVAGLVIIGVITQAMFEWRDTRRHPAPGQMVEVSDGRLIHAQVAGATNEGPVVVLEAGGGSFSSQWAWVQPQIAEFAPVVSYDRAGLGWSDPDETRHEESVPADLVRLLDGLELTGPYVLVGHSYGAVFARMFAHSHPDQVVGLVLVDPAHEEQFERIPAMRDLTQLEVLPYLSRVGLTRLLAPFDSLGEGMPAKAFGEWRSVAYTSRYARAYRDEGRYVRDVVSPWFAAQDRDLGELPLVVFRALDAAWPDDQAVVGMQRELADLSTRSVFEEIPSADHYTIVTQERNAQAVSEAVREMVEDYRASSGLSQ